MEPPINTPLIVPTTMFITYYLFVQEVRNRCIGTYLISNLKAFSSFYNYIILLFLMYNNIVCFKNNINNIINIICTVDKPQVIILS